MIRLFPGATLRLDHGRTLHMRTVNFSSAPLAYVRSVALNGQKVKGFILRHADLVRGGELVFEMATPSEVK